MEPSDRTDGKVPQNDASAPLGERTHMALAECDPRYRWIVERLGAPLNAIHGDRVPLSFIDSLTCNDLVGLKGFGLIRARKAIQALRDSAGLPSLDRDQQNGIDHNPRIPTETRLPDTILGALGEISFSRDILDPECRSFVARLHIDRDTSDIRLVELLAFDTTCLRDTGLLSASEIENFLALIEDVFMVRALVDYTQAATVPAQVVCRAIAMVYTAINNSWGFSEWAQIAGIESNALLQAIDVAASYLPQTIFARVAVYRIDLAVAKRVLEGETLRQVGDSIGVTRERIRQRLKRVGVSRQKIRQLEATQRTERKKLDSELHRMQLPLVEDFVRKHPGCFEHEIASHFGMPTSNIPKLVTNVSWLVLKSQDVEGKRVSDLPSILEARRKSIAALKTAATFCFPVTGVEYDSLLRQGMMAGPSRMRVIQVFGSWKAACAEAGVECGVGVLAIGQTANWTTTELVESVAAFLVDETFRGASYQYDEWRDKHNHNNDIPSFGTVRKRLGPSWRDVRRQALLSLRHRWEPGQQIQ